MEHDHDVLVVGGGPAGSSAAVFLARYGLDTVVFDRGRSSLRRCAHLGNYLGFPAGIDVETAYDLFHDHVRTAGAELRADVVESVERASDGDGFAVEPQEGDAVTARRVVAATRYGGEYLRPLDGDAMFEAVEYHGETTERFDHSYADADGSTPVDGLYVASPSAESDRQAIVAAGRGARVGLAVLEAVRRERGLPGQAADRYDWRRRDAERDAEWRDRDRWREWFDDLVPDGFEPDAADLDALREAEIDRRLATYIDDEEVARRRERGQERLLDHVDDDLILERAREIEGDSTASETPD